MRLTLAYQFLFLSFVAHPVVSPPSLRQENDDQEATALSKILENFENFNATNVFASFRLPPCVQDCVQEIGNTLATFNIEEGLSPMKTKTTCRELDGLKACLANKPNCNSVIIDIGIQALTFLCDEDEANTGLIPCVRRESLKIHATCERSCKLGATLVDAVSLNMKGKNAVNLIDEKGNKLLSVPDLHVLCNSSTCFLSCMRQGIEERCPNGGSKFVENIMQSIEKGVKNMPNLPETKVVDAYTSLISSFLPRQCQHLILKDKNIHLSTSGAPFSFKTFANKMDGESGNKSNSTDESEGDAMQNRNENLESENEQKGSGIDVKASVILLVALLGILHVY